MSVTSALSPGHVEIVQVSQFIGELEKLADGEKSFYRGQPVDKPLLPSVARATNQTNLEKLERSYLAEFRRRAAAFIDVGRLNDWELLAVAQHNGAPTRLLDWSRNPLAALWFSVATLPTSSKASTPVVWRIAVSSNEMSASSGAECPFEIEQTKWFSPPHASPRILAQESYFSIHKFSTKDRQYVPLEKQKRFRTRLNKFVVKPGREALILAQLDHLGVNHASLFPDLSGLSSHLALRFKLQVDEIAFVRAIRALPEPH